MIAAHVRPIKSAEDYSTAIAEIDRLIDAPEGSAEADLLEVLSVLAADYEDHHCGIDPPDPISFLEFIVASRGLTRKSLEPFIGHRSRVADILNRRRGLSMEMVRRPSRGLDLPADVLIRPYDLVTAPKEE